MEEGDKLVVFYSRDLGLPYDKIKFALDDDKDLHLAIVEYSKFLLKERNIETFQTEKNIIVTEEGYKVAMYYEEKE